MSFERTRSDSAADGGQLRQASSGRRGRAPGSARAARASASTRGRSSGPPTATSPAPRSATARRATSAKCSGGQRLVSQLAPEVQDQRGAATSASARAPSAVLDGDRQHESGGGDVGAERLGDRQQPIDGVAPCDAGREHAMRVEPGRALAGVGQPDADLRPVARAMTPERSNPWRSIVRSNRPRRSVVSGTGDQRRDPRGPKPRPAAVVDDHLVERGMAVEQRRGANGSPPRRTAPRASARAAPRGRAGH